MGLTPPWPTRRSLLLPGLVAVHLGLVAAATAGRPLAAPATPRSIATFAVVTALPLPPAAPVPIDLDIVTDVTGPVVEVAADITATAPGGPCALTADIEAALRADPEARAALAAVPASARSVADAVTLWNQRWSDTAPLGGEAALAPVRRTIVAHIRLASEACRAAPVTGPRLIYVPGPSGSTILAFGSGSWAWGDLLA